MKRLSFWGLVLLIPLVPIVWGLGSFIYPRFSDYSDLTISHLPNAVYIFQSILKFGSVPLWSDLLMGGYPLSADPLSGMWYPPNWIAILLPAPWGFNILTALHILWGGFGMAIFLSLSGLKHPASVFGGIAFAAMPKIVAHAALGHVSLIYAITWLPWLLAAEMYRTDRGSNQARYAFLPGVILGIIALADVRGAFYAGIIFFFFWLWNSILSHPGRLTNLVAIRKSGEILLQAVIGLAVAAVLLFPLAQFTSLSTRASLTSTDALVLSLPIKKIFNLFIPDFGGYAEWIIYPGSAVLFLIVLTLATQKLRKRLSFWLIVIGVCILLSFGSNLPVMSWIESNPITGMLRVPARWMFIGGMSMIIVASYAYNELISGYQKPKFDPIFWMVGICAFFVVLLIGSLIVKANVGLNLIWGITGFVLTILLIGFAERGRLGEKGLTAFFTVILIIDLVGENWQSIQYKPIDSVYQDGSAIVEELQGDAGEYRVYSPDYAISQLAVAKAGIEMVSAINPLQLATYSTWMTAASGSKSEAYSVAAPPLDDSNLAGSNHGNPIDTAALGMLNVKYAVANYPIVNTGLVEKWNDGNSWIYENRQVMQRAWVEAFASGGQTFITPAKIIQYQPGNIIVEAEGPGNLAISEVDYPGWTVTVDHEKASILRIAKLILGVKLDSGVHQIEFVYKPSLQYIGIAISLAAWMLMGAVSIRRRRE